MIDNEWLYRTRSEWATQHITEDDIYCYRTNYNPVEWSILEAQSGKTCIVPVGATLAIERLCCEVERLQSEVARGRRDALEEAAQLMEIQSPHLLMDPDEMAGKIRGLTKNPHQRTTP